MIESTETGTQVWSTTECAGGSIRPVRRRLAAYISTDFCDSVPLVPDVSSSTPFWMRHTCTVSCIVLGCDVGCIKSS